MTAGGKQKAQAMAASEEVFFVVTRNELVLEEPQSDEIGFDSLSEALSKSLPHLIRGYPNVKKETDSAFQKTSTLGSMIRRRSSRKKSRSMIYGLLLSK